MKKVYYSKDFCAEAHDVALIVANDEQEARELLKPHITTKAEPTLHRVSRAEVGVTILKDV
jgi:hypothetical protein